MTNYTNQELAQEYLNVVGSMGRVSSQQQRYARAIAYAPVDIGAYYNECHGIGKLQVSGVGKEAMTALDLILRKGNHGALRTIRDINATRVKNATRLEARLG